MWDGSVVLAKYIEYQTLLANANNPPTATRCNVVGKTVLEIGAGMGFVGLACAALGATTTITDLPYLLPALQAGVDASCAAWSDRVREQQQQQPPSVCALDWFQFPSLAKQHLEDARKTHTTPTPTIDTPNSNTDTETEDLGAMLPVRQSYDFIVGAEVFWLNHLLVPLIDTLTALLELNPNVRVRRVHHRQTLLIPCQR